MATCGRSNDRNELESIWALVVDPYGVELYQRVADLYLDWTFGQRLISVDEPIGDNNPPEDTKTKAYSGSYNLVSNSCQLFKLIQS